jgi:RNA polymerase sigma-70 factor (ECF subfamily)
MTAIEFHYNLISLEGNLKRFAFKLTADKEDAKDLVQDTFLKALKYYSKFVYESNFAAWTYTIMKNTFINNYRRSIKMSTINCQINADFLMSCATSPYLSDSGYALKEVEKTLESLNKDYKVPFKMHYKGFQYKEIAERLDVPLSTVKSRIFMARQLLRNQIAR